VKGVPLRWLKGHNKRGRVVIKGYRYVNRRQHLHRARAEQALGKRLPFGAEVHHVDGTKSDRSPLVICQDRAYHKLLHARTRILRVGGNPNTQGFCGHCQQLKPLEAFGVDRSQVWGRTSQCKACRYEQSHGWAKRQRETA